MANLISDFNVFFNSIFNSVSTVFNWFISTPLGEIILFMILISLFLFIINLFVDFKD